jgi:hypothetical protein
MTQINDLMKDHRVRTRISSTASEAMAALHRIVILMICTLLQYQREK